MSDRRDEDPKSRPSWRDLDRKKDRSAHVDGSTTRRNLDERKVTTGYHRYKDELDGLFSTGQKAGMVKKVLSRSPVKDKVEASGSEGKTREAPERQRMLRAVRAATSGREVTRVLDDFLGQWEMPEDIEILTQALEHEDETVQANALRMISSWLDGHIPRQKSLLTSRVRKLASRSDDEEVRRLAREVNRKM